MLATHYDTKLMPNLLVRMMLDRYGVMLELARLLCGKRGVIKCGSRFRWRRGHEGMERYG